MAKSTLVGSQEGRGYLDGLVGIESILYFLHVLNVSQR